MNNSNEWEINYLKLKLILNEHFSFNLSIWVLYKIENDYDNKR